jgi:acyl-CoA thioesterase II
MGDFERDTRVERTSAGYRAELRRDIDASAPNGSYLSAFALRAAGLEAAIPRPVSYYAHYLQAPRPGTVDLSVDTLVRDGRAESFLVRVLQGDKPVLTAMVRTARAGLGLEHDTALPPVASPPEQLPTPETLRPDDHEREPPLLRGLEVRVVQKQRFVSPRRSLPPRLLEWYRFPMAGEVEDPFVDACRSLMLIDTLCWPAASMPHPRSTYVAPSLELAVWFHRASLESEWLLADVESPVAADGCVAAHARVFSRAGKLVASGGTQLLCVPAPAPE